MDILQKLQDDEYSFPYHYVSQFQTGFTQCFYDSWGINYVATIEYVISRLNNEKFSTLIDIGCGDGRLVYELNQAFPDKEILGIDYSARAITLAKAMNPAGNYKTLDILSQTNEKEYDLAILMEVFEHIPPGDGKTFVSAIAKLLKKGSALYVTVPHVNKEVEYKHYRHFSTPLLIESFAPFFKPVEIVPFEKGKNRKKLLDFVLGNRFFILNSTRIRTLLYNFYKRNLFLAKEENCNRLLVKFVRE